MVNQVIPNASSDPRKVSIHKGIETEEKLTGKFKIQRLIRVWLFQFENINKKSTSGLKSTKKIYQNEVLKCNLLNLLNNHHCFIFSKQSISMETINFIIVSHSIYHIMLMHSKI